jgi:hypothetical protein
VIELMTLVGLALLMVLVGIGGATKPTNYEQQDRKTTTE